MNARVVHIRDEKGESWISIIGVMIFDLYEYIDDIKILVLSWDGRWVTVAVDPSGGYRARFINDGYARKLLEGSGHPFPTELLDQVRNPDTVNPPLPAGVILETEAQVEPPQPPSTGDLTEFIEKAKKLPRKPKTIIALLEHIDKVGKSAYIDVGRKVHKTGAKTSNRVILKNARNANRLLETWGSPTTLAWEGGFISKTKTPK